MADRTHEEEDTLTKSTDRDDRTGEGQGRGASRREEGRAPDEFVSSEVSERTARPGHPIKTRG